MASFELAARPRALTGRLRLLPAVLVDTAEQPVRLAAGPELLDDLEQRPLRLVVPAFAVEREPYCSRTSGCAGAAPACARYSAIISVVRLHVAVREQQVDEDAGLDLVRIAQLRRSATAPDRVLALGARLRETRP